MSVVQKLFSELAKGGTKGITIEGGGEPTLSPLFVPTVNSAKKLSLSLGLISNGLELFQADIKPSFYSAFQWIRISLDASSRKQYQKIKKGDYFEKILDNIKLLTNLRGHKPTIGVGYILTNLNDNLSLLTKLTKRLSDMGVDYLHFRPVVDHPKLVSPKNLTYLKNFETDNFSVNIGALADNLSFGTNGLPCYSHSLSVVITADGSVWLCGRLNVNPLAPNIGNLHKNSFTKIWLSKNRQQQAKEVSNPNFCQNHCPQCRMTKYNRLLNNLNHLKTRDFI
jgi:radical SAM protein with 4Fe4S-binding SPASM domain